MVVTYVGHAVIYLSMQHHCVDWKYVGENVGTEGCVRLDNLPLMGKSEVKDASDKGCAHGINRAKLQSKKKLRIPANFTKDLVIAMRLAICHIDVKFCFNTAGWKCIFYTKFLETYLREATPLYK